MKKSLLLSLFSGVFLFMANSSAVGTEKYAPSIGVDVPFSVKIITNEIHSVNENKIIENDQEEHNEKPKETVIIEENQAENKENPEENKDENELNSKFKPRTRTPSLHIERKLDNTEDKPEVENDPYETLKKEVDKAADKLVDAVQALVKAGLISSTQLDELINAITIS